MPSRQGPEGTELLKQLTGVQDGPPYMGWGQGEGLTKSRVRLGPRIHNVNARNLAKGQGRLTQPALPNPLPQLAQGLGLTVLTEGS